MAWLRLHCRPVGRPLLLPLALSGLAGAASTMCVSAKGSGSAYLLFLLPASALLLFTVSCIRQHAALSCAQVVCTVHNSTFCMPRLHTL